MSNTKNTHNKNNINIISNSEEKTRISSDILTNNFETLAKAKGGISKLRETILQLAVQGKLVPQNPEDEPASVLLKKIQAEKEKLLKEGKIKKQKALPPVDPEEVPYDLPKGWVWTRLGELGITQTGTTPPKNNPDFFGNYVPFIKPADITENKINYDNEGLSELGLNNGRSIPEKSVLMVCIGGSIGKTNITERDISCNQQINTVTPFSQINSNYLLISLKSNYFQDLVIKLASIGTLPIINKSKWEKIPFPLPPLAEQHRIVGRVDSLMKLCDELEARQNAESERRQMLLLSSLNCLFDSKDAAEADVAREILTENFGVLFDDKKSIAELRKTILQLAVQGKLVSQNPEDEPAAVLLKKIQAEKERLIKEGKIKKQKALSPVRDEDVPYVLPKEWVWTRLDDIITKIGSGSTPRGGKSVYRDEGIPFIRSQNVWNDGLKLDNVAYIAPEIHQNMSGTFVQPKDILLNITGASIGRSCLISDNFQEGNVSQHVSIIRSVDENIRQFLHLIVISPYFQSEIMKQQVGISREGLSKKILEQFFIPLPPLAEQHRIVERVDSLMKLCDLLEERVAAKEDCAERLLLSVCDGICG